MQFDDTFDQRSPTVRLGAIGEGWDLFLRRWPTWTLTTLIVIGCYYVATGLTFAFFRLPRPGGAGGFRILLTPQGSVVHAMLTMIVTGFFLGGMFRMACRQARGESIDVGMLFSVTDVLPQLVVGSALYGLACAAGFLCLLIPGFIAAGVLMFTLPLIVDAGLPATEALGRSWAALKGEWLSATVFHLAAWLIAGVGSCCCFGLLVTGPVYCLSIAILYRDFFLGKGVYVKG
jgi:hypothetical protein